MRNLSLVITGFIASVLLLVGYCANAETVFVLDTVQENTAPRWALATTSLVRDAVTSTGDHRLVQNESSADYVLQPKLLGLGDQYILTIEKKRGDRVVLAKQTRVATLDELDKAAARVTHDVLMAPVTSATTNVVDFSEPVADTNTLDEWQRGVTPVYDFWTFGVGPFGGTNLDTDKIMYSFALGHTWDIHPKVSINALGEAAFSTGQEKARLFNFGVGPSYYFSRGKNAQSPYASLDFGYGFGQANTADDINGFSLGVGVGYRFFRTATAGMELNLRWATLFDPVVNDGNPQIIGARLGVDF